jgi:UDP-glucose 4-epimerase
MKILVVGGAGYIGSHMVLMLKDQEHDTVVLDDLSGGRAEAVLGARLVQGSIGDSALLDQLLRAEEFEAVMHFASFIQVGESVVEPAKYYRNSFVNTLIRLRLAVSPRGEPSAAYNLGNGNGFSVREVTETVHRVTGKPLRVLDAPRRAGDPARLVADSTRARSALGWQPAYTELATIVAHAWAWERLITGI